MSNPNICPVCSSPISQGDTFCKVCGSEIKPKEHPIESEEPSQPPPSFTINSTPWFFFILGFVFGALAMGNTLSIVSSVEMWTFGGGSGSIGITILFGVLALISVGLGGFFLWKNRKSKLLT